MRHLIALTLFVGGLGLSGCSENKPKGDLPPLNPSKGKVMRGGSPVAGGIVQFRAEPAKPGSDDLLVNAEVNAEGGFELQTIHALSMKKAVGAPAGTYKVVYTPAMTAQTQNAIPVDLPKTVTIASGPNDLTIELPAGKK
ncbi:hypothetical protein [Zavarzinella formosa]|uniref:hypothetical protein n=1 Tax=Zavarzinella formosa TaxID=360055 RepID=UPI0002D77C94|nr:hypothetical protein [Zavarzinella formosa]